MRNYKVTNPSPSVEHQSQGNKAIDKFTEMMIDRMERLKAGDWKKGWIGGGAVMGMPQNLTGRNYSGSNSFFLQLDSALHNYRTPVYMTFHQAVNEGLHIKKGSTSMPVIYWDLTIKDKNGHKVSRDDYRNMTASEQQLCEVRPFMKSYLVFNIDQTNLEEVNKEKYDKILDRFKAPELRDTKGMYVNAALDRMFERQEWICKIQTDKMSDSAYYSPSRDIIVLPKKEQFNISSTPEEIYKDGMEYYSSALHEMTHSTGTPERLNRTKGDKFGDEKYAKEELVAELSAAMMGNAMGFDARILDNNAAYLDGWITTLREDPKFIVSVMADVNKASGMVLEEIDKQKIALGEKPLTDKYKGIQNAAMTADYEDAAIIKTKNGDYAIRASYNGQSLGMKPIDRETGNKYFALTEGKDRQDYLHQTAARIYAIDLFVPSKEKMQSLKVG